MKFFVLFDKNIVEGIVKYVKNDYAFDFEPIQNSCYSIMVGDLTISIDENLRAKQIWGYNPANSWIRKKLSCPIAQKGHLFVTDNLINDVLRLDRSKEWKTYYDNSSGWVCIGKCISEKNESVVEFATNVIAVIKNNKLRSLWIKPTFF